MKKWGFLLSVGMLSAMIASEVKMPLTHFAFERFSDQENLTQVKSVSGRETLKTLRGRLPFEQHALRLAQGAILTIDGVKLAKLSSQCTVSIWVLKKDHNAQCPLVMWGEFPKIGLALGFNFLYPVFYYSSNDWRNPHGVFTRGYYSNDIHYPDKNWQVPSRKLPIARHVWYHLAATFKQGLVKIYLNGQLFAERQSNSPQLTPVRGKLYLGAYRDQHRAENVHTADALVNDLRIYDRALTASAIFAQYQQDKPRYGARVELKTCKGYYPVEWDAEMKKTLPITREYEQKKAKSDTPVVGVRQAAIKTVNGLPELFINDQLEAPVQAVPAVYSYQDSEYKFREYSIGVRNFAAAGINKISPVTIHANKILVGENKYDFTLVDQVITTTLKANPHARIMLYLLCTAPDWFIRKYPKEMEHSYFGNNLRLVGGGPLGSDLWHSMQMKMLEKLVKYIEKQDYGKSVYAYMPGGGQSAEWYWPSSVTGGMPGYSPATQQSFRRWLSQKYQTPAALQKAWRQPQVDFKNATVPTVAERQGAEFKTFRDPQRAVRVLDFREYMTDRTVEFIRDSAKTIKRASNYKKLVMIYSGYDLHYHARKLFHSGLSGAWQVQRIPEVDMICTPIDYSARQGGDTGLRVNAFDGSAHLAGKLLWMEDDPRTHLFLGAESGRSRNLAETITVQKRTMSQAITRGGGCWWLVFENPWFHQQEIFTSLRQNRQIMQEALQYPRRSVAQAAVIMDEKSHYYLAASCGYFIGLHTWHFYNATARSGSLFDFYYQNDLADPRMPDYKLYFFISSYEVSAAERAVIQAKLARNHAVAVWCYAPGFFFGKNYSVDNMKKLTGLTFRKVDNVKRIAVKNTAQDKIFGALKYHQFDVAPAFFVQDSDAEIWAQVPNHGAVFAAKNNGQWTSVFALLPLEKNHIRALCRKYGVHCYLESDDMVMANQSYLMLHTRRAGDKTIKLPRKFDVYEVYSQRWVGRGITEFTERAVPAAETRLYRLTPVNFKK